jgi:hypothetical protein
MAFLLDTNVVSELRRPRPHGAVVAWLQSVEDADLHLASVTIGEIQAGIELTREQETDQGTLSADVRAISRTRGLGSISTRLILNWSSTLAFQLADGTLFVLEGHYRGIKRKVSCSTSTGSLVMAALPWPDLAAAPPAGCLPSGQ